MSLPYNKSSQFRTQVNQANVIKQCYPCGSNIPCSQTIITPIPNDLTVSTLTVGGKATILGLIDPTGMEFTPVSTNPGNIQANTIWANSTDLNKLYYGSTAVGGGGGGWVGTAESNLDMNSYNITAPASSGLSVLSGASLNLSSADGSDINVSSVSNINLTGNSSTGTINVNAYNGIVINSQSDYSSTALNGLSIETTDTTNPSTTNSYSIFPSEITLGTTNISTLTSNYILLQLAGPFIEIYDDNGGGGSNLSRVRISDKSFEYSYSIAGTKPTYFQFQILGNNIFRYDLNGIQMGTGGIKYTNSYGTSNVSLTSASNTIQTFNGSNLITTLPSVTATNVGIQFITTNTNASALTVSSTGGQIIYSTGAVSTGTSRTLTVGNSQIFTGIRTTGTGTYGWSMV